MRKSALVGWLLLAPSLVLLGGLVVFPVLYNLWLSLFDKHAFMPVQSFVGLRHYRYFATDPEFWASFYYGSVYAGVTMVLQLGVGVPAALLLGIVLRGAAFVFRGYAPRRQRSREVRRYLRPSLSWYARSSGRERGALVRGRASANPSSGWR